MNSPFVFTVDFGDGTMAVKEQSRADVVHQYRAASSYAVSVSLSTVPGSEVFVTMPIVRNNNVPVTVVSIELSTSPPMPTAGEAVTFMTQFQSSDPNIRYRFNFGDGSSSDWSTTPQAFYMYPGAGRYPAYAEVGRSSTGLPDSAISSITQSTPTPILVAAAPPPAQPAPPPQDRNVVITRIPIDPTPDTPWATYAIVALSALALGYGAKHWLFPSQLTLEAHRDAGTAGVAAERQALAIQVEIRVHHGLIDGESRLGTGEAGLVKAIRRKHG